MEDNRVNYDKLDDDERTRYTITNRNGYQVYCNIHNSYEEAVCGYVKTLIEVEGYRIEEEALEPCEYVLREEEDDDKEIIDNS
tara:strand:+ start:79 stop:327 length:249 start_codon:yes stop_codon:yes gene_type:complete